MTPHDRTTRLTKSRSRRYTPQIRHDAAHTHPPQYSIVRGGVRGDYGDASVGDCHGPALCLGGAPTGSVRALILAPLVALILLFITFTTKQT
jgi:hypothetical protein